MYFLVDTIDKLIVSCTLHSKVLGVQLDSLERVNLSF